MMREPDWETLSEINFLMARRMTDQLSGALHLMGQNEHVAHMRASGAVQCALDLYGAWADLIRYKAGEAPLNGSTRFDGRELLEWIATTLQIGDLPEPDQDVTLKGNKATLQEALILLQSCAHTLGPGVRVRVESQRRGLWFRVNYANVGQASANLEELLARLRANWRLQSAAFELRCARDFLMMNACELFYAVRDQECEFSFFVWFATQPTGEPSTKDKAKALLDSYNSDDTYEVITD
jgi:hypothetical protein